MYWLLKDRLDRSLLRRFFLILIVASMFPNHLLDYYAEVFTVMLVTVGTVAAIVGPSLVAWSGWLLVMVGVANIAANLGALVLLVGKYVLDTKRLRYLLVIAGTLLIIGAEDWLRHGNPFNTGYGAEVGPHTIMPYSGLPGFSNPLFFGLIGLLISSGKGLLFFTPGLLLPVRRTLRRLGEACNLNLYGLYLLWIAYVIGLLLVYAQWWSWQGGWFWGPRFILMASVPASFALAVRLHDREGSLLVNLLTFGIFCLSLWVGIDGAVYGMKQLAPYCLNSRIETPLCYYTPEFSALWHPFVVPQPLSLSQIVFMLYCVVVGIYLLIPLVRRLIPQLLAVARLFAGQYLRVREWRV